MDPGGADVVHPLKAAGLADPHVASLAEVAERRAGYRFAHGRGASASAPRPRLLESTDEDTLVGYQLPAYQTTASRKPVATAKLYLFDVDVANTLRRAGSVEPGSDAYVRALEHLVFLELRSFLDYRRRDEPLVRLEEPVAVRGGLRRRREGGDRGDGQASRHHPRPQRPAGLTPRGPSD